MIVGVIGNARYHGLPAVLEWVRAAADRFGVHLRTEPDLSSVWSAQPMDPAEPLDAMLTFGGDGTLLRGARLLAAQNVPMLGVNLGRVGFLTAATREDYPRAIEALFSGRYEVESRQTLESHILSGTRREDLPRALNDVVIHKSGLARMIRLDVLVDGDQIGPYSADGLIVATPTGSTAYSLSAGGPVIAPGVEGTLLTPICAHTLAVRPFVVSAKAEVTIAPRTGWDDDLLVSVDGQRVTALAPNDRVVVRRAPERVRLVRLPGTSYFERVRETLRWGDLSERETRE